jgi:hypothetical protein
MDLSGILNMRRIWPMFTFLLLFPACQAPAASPLPTVAATAVTLVLATDLPATATAVPPTIIPASPTPLPTVTAVPPTPYPDASATATPSPTATPTPAPTPRAVINGIPIEEIIIMSPNVIAHMRQVFSAGQASGRSANTFSKIGDSVIANGDFLTRFDAPRAYMLGPYEDLQPVIDFFRGSWKRYGVGMHVGLRAWGVFDPLWADKDWCEPNETLIDCEFRLNNPSVVVIHIGSNDLDPTFDHFMRDVVQHSLDNGIIPIILTKADRYEGEDNRNNIAMRQIAADYEVPLLDFDIVAETLPNRGIKEGDNVHLSGPLQFDYNLPETYEKGHSVHNLTVLFMLERVLNEIILPEIQDNSSG